MGLHSQDDHSKITITRTHLITSLTLPLEDRMGLKKHLTRLAAILKVLEIEREEVYRATSGTPPCGPTYPLKSQYIVNKHGAYFAVDSKIRMRPLKSCITFLEMKDMVEYVAKNYGEDHLTIIDSIYKICVDVDGLVFTTSRQTFDLNDMLQQAKQSLEDWIEDFIV